MLSNLLRNLFKMSQLSRSPITIGTHNGHFHADEALAVYMLRQLPLYEGAKVIRTRNPDVLATCHTVVDVGGVYDVSTRRFDHHQRDFTTVFPSRETKLSSAGLVYAHFGRSLVAEKIAFFSKLAAGGPSSTSSSSSSQKTIMGSYDRSALKHSMGSEPSDPTVPAPCEAVQVAWERLYRTFVEAVDANDNGVSAYDGEALRSAGIERRFSEHGTSLAGMVSRFNAHWNSAGLPSIGGEDARFEAASAIIGEAFVRELDYVVGAWIPARDIVRDAYARRKTVGVDMGLAGGIDAQGRVLLFESAGVPWKDHLMDLEEEDEKEEEKGGEGGASSDHSSKVLYVVFKESPTPDAKWRIQAAPANRDTYESRKALPLAWRGLRDEELDRTIGGVPGAVFAHASGFIGGHKTFEGVVDMTRKALEM